jgi:LmbE family N-acetylglucosaminyl deacetylase
MVWTLAGVLAMGCGGSSSGAQLTHRPRDAFDAYGQIATAAAESPCSPVTAAGPIPTAPQKRAESDFGTDVVFYLAHPEDETLFTPGTMAALVRANRRVFDAVMTHGEGGRLLDRAPDGSVTERTGVPPAKVAEVRDREFANVMKTLGIEYEYMFPASVQADFAAKDVEGHDRAVHACAEVYERWDEILPGGLSGLLNKLVASIRTKKPRVIVTHDHRDDDDWLDHGHHKALGALVEMAARAAANPRAPGGPPHVVEEVVAIAPKQVNAEIQLPVGTDMRKRLMLAHASQFETQKYAEVAERKTERFVVRWRAKGVEAPGGSVLGLLVKPR